MLHPVIAALLGLGWGNAVQVPALFGCACLSPSHIYFTLKESVIYGSIYPELAVSVFSAIERLYNETP
jgi:hypothetical protein